MFWFWFLCMRDHWSAQVLTTISTAGAAASALLNQVRLPAHQYRPTMFDRSTPQRVLESNAHPC
jgi:hypothetical protein